MVQENFYSLLKTFTPNLHLIWSEFDYGRIQSLYLVPEVLCSLWSYFISFHFILLYFILLLLHFFHFIFGLWGSQGGGQAHLPLAASLQQLPRRGGSIEIRQFQATEDCDFTLFYSESCYFSHACKTNNSNNTFHFFMMTSFCYLRSTFCVCLRIEFPLLGGKCVHGRGERKNRGLYCLIENGELFVWKMEVYIRKKNDENEQKGT